MPHLLAPTRVMQMCCNYDNRLQQQRQSNVKVGVASLMYMYINIQIEVTSTHRSMGNTILQLPMQSCMPFMTPNQNQTPLKLNFCLENLLQFNSVYFGLRNTINDSLRQHWIIEIIEIIIIIIINKSFSNKAAGIWYIYLEVLN